MTTLRGGGKVWKFEGRAIVDGELAAEAMACGPAPGRAETSGGDIHPSAVIDPAARIGAGCEIGPF